MSGQPSTSQVPKLPLIPLSSAVASSGALVAVSSRSNSGQQPKQQQQQPTMLVSSSRTKYSLTPRADADAAGARVLTPRDLQTIGAYIDANKRLNHKHRVGRAGTLIPAAPFAKVRDRCDAVLGLSLAAVDAKESALDYPLRLRAPDEYHTPTLVDPPARTGLATRIVRLLKGATSVPQHWRGEKRGTERDVAHINALRDVEMRVVAARRAQNVQKEALAVFALGSMHYNASNIEKAAAQFHICAALFEHAQDPQGVALCHNLLGVCHYRLGDPKTALVHHKKVEVLSAAYCRAVAQLNIGVCYIALDEIDFALQAFTDANSSALAAEDSVLEALAVGNLGLAFMRQGDMRQAQANVEQCLEHCSIAGDKAGAAVCLLLLGEIYSSVKDFGHAQFYYEHAFRIAEEARCSDVAEVARVGVGVARGSLAIRERVLDSAGKMGKSMDVGEVLLLMSHRNQQSQQLPLRGSEDPE